MLIPSIFAKLSKLVPLGKWKLLVLEIQCLKQYFLLSKTPVSKAQYEAVIFLLFSYLDLAYVQLEVYLYMIINIQVKRRLTNFSKQPEYVTSKMNYKKSAGS